jgi:enamine deaminase RidA (YjgF/YER057c/UK114 family)
MNGRAFVLGVVAILASGERALARALADVHKQGGHVMRLLKIALLISLMMPAGVAAQTAGVAEDNLKKKNINLPSPATPVANYVPAVQVGSLMFLSGAGPAPSEPWGKVGKDLTLDQGYQAARSTCLNLMAATRGALGSLDKVKRVVKVFGMVNSAPVFTDQPKVSRGGFHHDASG